MKIQLTEEGSSGKDGGDEGLPGGRDTETEGVGSIDRDGVTEELEPVLHGSNTRDGTGVVTEEDTGKGSKADHEDACELVLAGVGTEARARGSGTTSH